jgi:hypothetical protein
MKIIFFFIRFLIGIKMKKINFILHFHWKEEVMNVHLIHLWLKKLKYKVINKPRYSENNFIFFEINFRFKFNRLNHLVKFVKQLNKLQCVIEKNLVIIHFHYQFQKIQLYILYVCIEFYLIQLCKFNSLKNLFLMMNIFLGVIYLLLVLLVLIYRN